MRAVLTFLALYVGGSALAACWVRATKPTACPRGHTDFYMLDGWRCRVCERVGHARRLRRRAREGREATSR